MASKNQEGSNYEKIWQQAFEDAEMKPSADIWKNIDNQLTRQESGKYKRGFLFYRAVAAACLLCLLGLSIYAVNDYLLHKQDNQISATQEGRNTTLKPSEPKNSALDQQDTPKNQAERNSNLFEQRILAKKAPSDDTQTDQKKQATSSLENATPSQRPLSSDWMGEQENPAVYLAADNPNNPMGEFSNAKISLVASNGFYEEPVKGVEWLQDIDQLYRVPNPYGVEQKKEDKNKPTFFAGIDFSGNYFDPNFSASAINSITPAAGFDQSGAYYDLRNNQENGLGSQSSANAPGINNIPQASFSYGANVGVTLSKYLTLESGVDYGRFNTNTETNWAVERLESEKPYPFVISSSTFAGTNNISYTSTTELTNSFELLIVPMKLGYNLYFDKVNLFISSGVAANFFIKNSISDASGKFTTLNIQSDTDSPYRNIFYSGVVSGGVNYNFTGNYFLTLSPEYSFSITPMTKDKIFIVSQPYMFGMDIGLRYIFK